MTTVSDVTEDVRNSRPLANELAIQRGIFHQLKANNDDLASLELKDTTQCVDYIESVNDLDWFAEELPGNVQMEKIVGDTLCRSDIIFDLKVQEKLNRPNLVNSLGDRHVMKLKENLSSWIKSSVHKPPLQERKKKTSVDLRYFDRNDHNIKTIPCWEGTALYELCSLVKMISDNTPFTEESLLLYVDLGIRPIMARWRILEESETTSGQLTITFNTSMLKTNDFQMIRAKLEEEKGKIPSYIDWKDHILFHVVWQEFDGPPQVKKMKIWEEILSRVAELGVDKWSAARSVRKRWERLKEKISADPFGQEWIEKII